MNRNLQLFLGVMASFATGTMIAHAAGKPTFAIVPKSISVAFYADVEKGCKEEGDKLGVNVIYTGPDTPDPAKQVQILQDLVSRGVDGFAVAPMDAESVIGVIDAALKKGIKVITFDSDSPKSKRTAFVGTNNYQGGVEAGKAFATNQPDGKFAVIKEKHYVDALIGQRPYAMGVKSVDVLNDLVQGKTVPAVIDTGVDVITQDNVDQFLQK